MCSLQATLLTIIAFYLITIPILCSTEPWFELPYVEVVIPAPLLDQWRSVKSYSPELELPPPNHFIPTDFALQSDHAEPEEGDGNGPSAKRLKNVGGRAHRRLPSTCSERSKAPVRSLAPTSVQHNLDQIPAKATSKPIQAVSNACREQKAWSMGTGMARSLDTTEQTCQSCGSISKAWLCGICWTRLLEPQGLRRTSSLLHLPLTPALRHLPQLSSSCASYETA